ncbi:hypothetical protein B296_00014209, partial [Ensete ventricosum]
MIPMAVLLAERGARVSFITTPVNAARTEVVIRRVRRAGLAVELLIESTTGVFYYSLPLLPE